MSISSSDELSVESLAEEFLERRRRGERPTVAEYAARHPHLAGEIREFFPVLGLVEDFKPDTGDVTGSIAGPMTAGTGTTRERLGDFRLLREVGRGGMGVVYEAEQESLGRRVALKVLGSHQLLDPGLLVRFHREAKAAARLHHTNIVPVFGVGEHEGMHFYVMQFIPGLALDAVLDEVRRLGGAKPTAEGGNVAGPGRPTASTTVAGALTAADLAQSLAAGRFVADQPAESVVGSVVEQSTEAFPSGSSVALPGQADLSSANDSARLYVRSVARVGLQAAEAVAYAHQQGILHRDIKPANLLLDARGTVWVTDFGLAKIASESNLTRTGDVVGTIRYMAPERFEGRCDARADIYALGLTLYEFLARRPAFAAEDRHALIRQVTQTEPKALRQIVARVPRDLETIIHTAIAKNPKDRYATAAELRDELQRFLDDRPILARRISYAERLERWARRNPVLAGLSAALLLAIMAGTTLSWVLTIRANAEASRANGEANRANGEATRANDEATRALAAEIKAREAEKTAVAEAERIRRLLYDADMNVAAQLWENADGSPRAIEEVLAAHQPSPGQEDLRDFSWRYQWNLLHNSSVVYTGHKGSVLSRLSADGGLVTVDGELVLRHWDRDLRSVIWSKKLQSDSDVTSMALSADGRVIALANKSGAVSLFEAADGKEGRVLQAGAAIYCLAFAPDGNRLVSIGEDLRAILWDAATGQEAAIVKLPFHNDGVLHNDRINQAVLTPDGLAIILAGQPDFDHVAVYEIGRSGTKYTIRDLASNIGCVACSPDGRTAAWGDENGQIFFFEVATGERIGEPLSAHAVGVFRLAFSPDGSQLVSGGLDAKITLWDVARREPIRSIKGHTGPITSLSFSADGNLLVSGSRDGSARIWGLTGAGTPRIFTKSIGSNILDVAFSGDGRWMATGDVVPRIWDARTGRLIHTLAMVSRWDCYRVAFSPDSGTLATGGLDSRVSLWDVATGRPLRSLDGRTAETSVIGPDRAIGSLAFSADGKLVAAGFGELGWNVRGKINQVIKIWEAGTGRVVQVLTVNSTVRTLAFSPDGRRLAAACADNGVRVWEIKTWSGAIWPYIAQPSSGQDDPGSMAYCAAYSPDGSLLAAGFYNGVILIWDATTGRFIHRLRGRHHDFVRNVAFSADGRTLASAGHDKAVKLWDVRSGRELRTLLGHGAGLTALACSPDGNTIATGGEDQTFRLWEAASPLEIALVGGDDRAFEAIHRRDVAAHPGDPHPWTRRALVYARQGQPDRAVGDLLKALDLAANEHPDRPMDPEAFALEVSAWTSLFPRAVHDRVARVASRKPAAVLQAAIAAGRDDPRVWLARSRVFTLLGMHGQADADLTQALKLTPDRSGDWLLWMESGRFFAEHDRPRMAAASFARADGLDCHDPELLMTWGRLFAEDGDWARAAASFGRAFESRPDDLLAGHLWAVLARQADGRPGFRLACTRLERFGQTIDPWQSGFLVFTLIQNADAVGDWERVIRLGEQAVANSPDTAAWYYALAGAYLRSGRYEQALRSVDEADRHQPDWPSRVLIDLMRAIVHLRLADPARARPFLSRADDWCAPLEAGAWAAFR